MSQKLAKILSSLLFVLILSASCKSSEQDKLENIINQLNLIETQRFQYTHQIEALKYQTSGKDSIRVCEIEVQLSDDNIKRKIVKVLQDSFTSKEIDELYQFFNSTVYEKFIKSGTIYTKIFSEFEDIGIELKEISDSNIQDIPKPKRDFVPIPVNRIDGFYETVNYSQHATIKESNIKEFPVLTPKDIVKVTRDNSRNDGITEINILFSREGARKFQKLTKDNIGKPLPIVINKRIISMPTINSQITGGRASISGDFSEVEADDIISKLKNNK